MTLRAVLFILLGYLSGGVMYSYYIPRLLTDGDVREQGADHNPGAANAFRLCGPAVGVLCALLDVLKATLPVYAAATYGGLTGMPLAAAALAPVLGHAYPVTLRFRGGKAIASAFGALLGLWPVTHAVLLLAAIVLILLPLVHDHALLMLTSLCVFAVLTLNMAVHEAHLVAIGLLAIVGGRHLREARGALEDIRARREERRRAA